MHPGLHTSSLTCVMRVACPTWCSSCQSLQVFMFCTARNCPKRRSSMPARCGVRSTKHTREEASAGRAGTGVCVTRYSLRGERKEHTQHESLLCSSTTEVLSDQFVNSYADIVDSRKTRYGIEPKIDPNCTQLAGTYTCMNRPKTNCQVCSVWVTNQATQ